MEVNLTDEVADGQGTEFLSVVSKITVFSDNHCLAAGLILGTLELRLEVAVPGCWWASPRSLAVNWWCLLGRT